MVYLQFVASNQKEESISIQSGLYFLSFQEIYGLPLELESWRFYINTKMFKNILNIIIKLQTYFVFCQNTSSPCADSDEGQGSDPSPPPPLKSQLKGYLAMLVRIPLKVHKATKSAFNAVPSSACMQNSFRLRSVNGPPLVVFGSLSPFQLETKQKHCQESEEIFWMCASK